MDYTIRCQSLLQLGQPVVDIAVWTGDDYPRRAVHPERLVPLMPGIFGPERVQSELARHAADPMERDTSACGVVYPKNASLPQDWINPMYGYHYDSFNSDALQKRTSAKEHRMVLDSGMEYGVLVVPPADIHQPNGVLSKATKKAIRKLKRAGVPVIDRFPFEDSDLACYGIEPDFTAIATDGSKQEGLNFCHRRTEAEEIYFVANHDAFVKEFKASFRVAGKTPEIWVPTSGEIIRETEFAYVDGRTEMPLRLDGSESLFIVFRDVRKQSTAGGNIRNTKEEFTLGGPWKVDFSFRGKQASVVSKELSDWTESGNPFIKYYSGTASYSSIFTANVLPGKRYFLEFDRIGNIAEIKVNGVVCGTLWTPPYRVEVTQALRDGENIIEIQVANTWANRIKGVKEGAVSGEDFWTLVPYWPEVPLQKSGISGSVRMTTL